MTVAGETALSVDTRTKTLTPAWPEIRAMSRVAIALLRTASTGFCSMRPTCLYAAAWKTIVGRYASKTSRMRSSSLQSARTASRRGGVHVAVVLELALDLKEVVLGMVEQHEAPRRDACDLARELLADRAPGAGDEHDLARQVRADAIELHPHGLAPEDVLDLHLAHLLHGGRAGLQELEHRRQGAHRNAALAACAHDVRAQDAGRRRDRDRDLVGLDLLEDAPELARRAEDLDAVDPQAALRRVVVDEADGLQAELGVAQDLAQHEAPAVAGADDEQPACAGPGAEAAQRALVDRPRDEAGAADEGEHEQEEQHDDAGRRRDRRVAGRRALGDGLDERDVARQQQRGDDDRLEDPHVVALRDVAPPLLVEPERGEHEHRAGHDRRRTSPRAGPRSASGSTRGRRSAAGRRASTRARPEPRRPRSGGANDGAGERPRSGSVGASCRIVRARPAPAICRPSRGGSQQPARRELHARGPPPSRARTRAGRSRCTARRPRRRGCGASAARRAASPRCPSARCARRSRRGRASRARRA